MCTANEVKDKRWYSYIYSLYMLVHLKYLKDKWAGWMYNWLDFYDKSLVEFIVIKRLKNANGD
jgi:hypothetical protein